MFRIDHSTAAGVRPAPAAAGTPGFFSEGDVLAGQPATVVTADWLNMMQEEFVSILTEAGIVPNKSNLGQVLAALGVMFARKNTAGDVFAGSLGIAGSTFFSNDAHFAAWKSGTTPVIELDEGDFFNFDRALNILNLAIGNVTRHQFSATGMSINGNQVYHAGNDGAGSGLDAGLFAGQLPSAFAMLTGAAFSGGVGAPALNPGNDGNYYLSMTTGNPVINFDGNDYLFYDRATNALQMMIGSVSRLAVTASSLTRSGSTVWDAGNDGPGSGMDADFHRGLTPAQVSASGFTSGNTADGWWEKRPSGFVSQGNIITATLNEGDGPHSVTFPTPFPTAVLSLTATGYNSTGSTLADQHPQIISYDRFGFTYMAQYGGSGAATTLTGMSWQAFGN